MWSFLGFTALQCLRCPFFSAPSASKNFFPQQLFSPLPNSLHCIAVNDFSTSPLKQTRKPPSHPYLSPHTFPLPSCYSSLAQGSIFTVTASWVPYNSHFSSLTNFSLSLSVVLVFSSPSVLYIPFPCPFSLPALWIRISECCANVFFYLVWGIPFVDVSKARAACVMNVYFNVNRVMKPPVPSCLWFRILPNILYSPMEPLSICHPWHNCHWANSSYHCLLLPSFLHFLFLIAIQKSVEEG